MAEVETITFNGSSLFSTHYGSQTRGNLYLQDSPEGLQVAALALNDRTQDMTSDNLGKEKSSQDIQLKEDMRWIGGERDSTARGLLE